jgi:hypothetical protein
MARFRTYPQVLFSGAPESMQQHDYAWETIGQ